VPLTVTTSELAAARARVKKDKFRLLTLDHPDPDKLVSAVQKGIWDCIKLYTERPPRGSKNNFGLAAYKRWAKLLTRPKQRLSWAKEFPPGRKMAAGLTSAFHRIAIFGSDGVADAERNLYASFLDEASLLLHKPDLKEVAQQFRASAQAWEALGNALLPNEVPSFKTLREALVRQHHLFLEEGNAALPEIEMLRSRVEDLKDQLAADFPLSEAEVTAMRENLRDHVMTIHDIEAEAIANLQAAMAQSA
jgi:hypothetical protein